MADNLHIEKLPLDVIGYIFAKAGSTEVMKMSSLSKWWKSLCTSEHVWKDQCFIMYTAKKEVAESQNIEVVGAQSFSAQKGSLSWRDYWFSLKKNAHFVACSYCSKYPLMDYRFECLLCENYFLCIECEAKNNEISFHPKSHLYALMYYPVALKFYFTYSGNNNHIATCTRCGKNPFEGKKYSKDNQILCGDCYSGLLGEGWLVQKYPDLRTYEPSTLGQNHRGARCDCCMKPSIPINWKCTCCYDYDLCDTCLKDKRHKKKHAIMKLYYSIFSSADWRFTKQSKRFVDASMNDESDYDDL